MSRRRGGPPAHRPSGRGPGCGFASDHAIPTPNPAGGGFGLGSGSHVWFLPKLGRRGIKLRRHQGPTAGGVLNPSRALSEELTHRATATRCCCPAWAAEPRNRKSREWMRAPLRCSQAPKALPRAANPGNGVGPWDAGVCRALRALAIRSPSPHRVTHREPPPHYPLPSPPSAPSSLVPSARRVPSPHEGDGTTPTLARTELLIPLTAEHGVETCPGAGRARAEGVVAAGWIEPSQRNSSTAHTDWESGLLAAAPGCDPNHATIGARRSTVS